MKTIANCNPVEFLTQTNKIRKQVQKYFDVTKILDIRKTVPEIKGTESVEEKAELLHNQGLKNLEDMFDTAMEKYPQQTAEVLGLLCFINPEDLEKHKGVEFLIPAMELLKSEEAISFFTSLVNLGNATTKG